MDTNASDSQSNNTAEPGDETAKEQIQSVGFTFYVLLAFKSPSDNPV